MSAAVEAPHVRNGAEMSSKGERDIGTSFSGKRTNSLFDVIPISIRNFERDEDDDDIDVGDIDVDAPISAEDQNLLNEISECESFESELDSVSKDRRDLFASPLLLAALSESRIPEQPTAAAMAYRKQEHLLQHGNDHPAIFSSSETPYTQEKNNGLESGRPSLENGASRDNDGDSHHDNDDEEAATPTKQGNPYRRKEIWVAAIFVVLSAIAVGVAVPVVNQRKNSSAAKVAPTQRPTFSPLSGTRTFAPSPDPLISPTTNGRPSFQSSRPISSQSDLPLSTSSPSQLRNTSPTNIPSTVVTISPTNFSQPTQSPSILVITSLPTSKKSPLTLIPTTSSSIPSSASIRPTQIPSVLEISSEPTTIIGSATPSNTANISRTESPTRPPSTKTTVTPSASPFESRRRGDITALIYGISGVFVFLNGGSPQARALQWILNEDPRKLLANDTPAIVQRYVLATLYFSTNSNSTWMNCAPQETNTTCESDDIRFLSNSSECQWYGVECNNSSITSLDFRLNGMQGQIPRELAELIALTQLTFSRNFLSSTIPTDLGKLLVLERLLLNRNNLTGTIPSELGSLSSIQYLHLGRNLLNGTIPSEIFTNTTQNLDLGYNRLQGKIPNIVALSPAMVNIDLGNNRLTGPIHDFGNLTSLISLALDNNLLSGKISSAVVSSATTALTIGGNNISGSIPENFFSRGKSLTLLNMGNNSIEGTLSTRFGELSNLEQLVLSYNEFTGEIPSEFGELRSLDNLELEGNQLVGSLPSEVCALRTALLAVLSTDCDLNCSCCSSCL